jgi:hypothetical protein
MVYDPSTRNIVIVSAPASPYTTHYTWLFNIDTNTYTMLTNAVQPSCASGDCELAYDSNRGLVWFFGGGTYEAGGNELWQFNSSTLQWQKILPTSPVWPGNRIYHGFAYDSKNDVLFLYGGTAGDGGAALTDSWAYSPASNSWQQIQPANSPTAGTFVNLVYDASKDVYVAHIYNAGWWVFRYAPPASAKPTPPTNLSIVP